MNSLRLFAAVVLTSAFCMVGSCTVAAAEEGTAANRLARESSPYLLLHAHNPVDWYPWGPEAFEKARRENKPIFLSIGYSSCFWCHVMERKVFSNAAIAEFMNQHFVNIKVDREERPDVDDIYMTSLLVYQQLAGSGGGGGWPLSMFLTPDGEPMAGATYLPPEDSPDGRTGFLTAAKRIDSFWRDRPENMQRTADIISAEVRRLNQPPDAEAAPATLDAKILEETVEAIASRYDAEWGGVDFDPEDPDGSRFPNVPRLEFLLDQYQRTGSEEALNMVTHSLTRMASGGIRDHLAGGFHRYSTDRRWHVPHFEKMLYDQAMMLGIYSRCADLTEEPLFAAVAAEIADFIHHEMTLTDGGFCSALDAETDHIEGQYYVWSRQQVTDVLREKSADLFLQAYGFDEANPFEHGNVLHLPVPLAQLAQQGQLDADAVQADLATARKQLLQARSERKRPLLDDKVLTAWNAMMIRSLAQCGRLLNRPQDTAAAVKAADFLLHNLRDEQGQLLRSWRNGQARHQAYLDDYAFLVSALLELHQTTGQEDWLTVAQQLNQQQQQLFFDADVNTYYFTASNHEKLIARTSSAYDSVFPSGNSISVRNLIRLAKADSSQAELAVQAEALLQRFTPTMEAAPVSCAGLAAALNDWLTSGLSDRVTSADANAAEDVFTARNRRPQYLFATASQQDPPAAEGEVKSGQQHRVFRPITLTADEAAAEEQKPQKPLSVGVYPMYDKLVRGRNNYVAIELKVSKGWHINANPASPDYLVPTTVKVKTKQKVKLSRVKFPKHEEFKVAGSLEPYHVYGDTVIVYGLLETNAAEPANEAVIEFEVAYQACNDKECLPPDKIVMKGKLPIANPGDPVRKINEDKFPKPKSDKAGDGSSQK
jgi:uncharacterized protein YyaL (SSP411 family)